MSAVQALVFARCLGFVVRAPGFSHPSVPAPVRACFALVLALALARGRVLADVSTAALVPALAIELALGAAIGVAASALYDGAYSGGRLVDDYVGIRISVPTAGIVAGAGFGRLWSLAFVAAFFAFGGHRVLLAALAGTFDWLPPGAALRPVAFAAFATAVPGTLVRAALAVAGPALALAFATQLALAAIARVVPRFSTFALAFAIVLGVALLATVVEVPALLPVAARPWLDLDALRGR